MADEDDDTKEEASSEPPPAAKAAPEEKKADADDEAEVEKTEPDKPVSKAVEWALAIAMMVILIGFLFMMMHMMRSARTSVM